MCIYVHVRVYVGIYACMYVYIDTDNDIFVNCNWVDSQWQ